MLKKIKTLDMSRDDWLAERRNSLGGSDMGAILGLNPYRSPYNVWSEKTGRIPEKVDNEAMRQGRDLEAYVAQRFAEVSGKNVERCNYILRNTDVPYIHANIDRRIIKEKSGLECKTASALNLKAYHGGEFPGSYYAQCVTYLAVTGWTRWYLAALILGKAFWIYQLTTVPDDDVPEWCESSVYVNPDELTALKECAVDFWESYILPDIQPPLDGRTCTTDAMQNIYGCNGSEIVLSDRGNALEQYLTLNGQKKALEQEMEKIKQTIMQDMGQAERASCGAYRVSWKEQSQNRFDLQKFKKTYPKMDLSGFYREITTRPFKVTIEA